ncbi:MAG: cofactor assembly of complex C subunit B [Limnospira sp. PMC 1291.21]|uniref:cofactor assembly of complex C subunit B n=1 Tax=unclassified Limnospira TaxID=2642885 RepID=UPI0028E0FCE6|nr:MULTISPECIES: cofactor assembly of complex C subunit B [unclassified Limnospira]MDT9177263.1 cofactor assembly of complex C subunit B [Limnospira sp. PMC 1238.20]MDT9192471.1 cofactor assembly of complex C subunit B [Limnospira sp. PMC 1245.20]MDT9204600.1 cofactor assembly of complex C subunit B [Limnospira sp. PMC 1243.20]MDT9207979.1 cofactor assembly of complex C subunit B [Limnospira sp. PMC 1252.20]MDT9213094.1 cofactor assembly of complex C subunit B [Limnospira sp. PMC 1256.20]
MAQINSNRVLRLLPLVVGGLGGVLLLVNRLETPQILDSQARSDALGVILSALLILTGLLWQQIQPVPPDAVELEGPQGFELQPDLPDVVKTELAWASLMLLTNTVTRSLLVVWDAQVLLRRGVLGVNSQVEPGPIVKRVQKTRKPVYLVNLALYPGRIEFDYLPPNTQGVICQPMGDRGVLILGANTPRSYTKQDEVWIEGIADKLADTLERSGWSNATKITT